METASCLINSAVLGCKYTTLMCNMSTQQDGILIINTRKRGSSYPLKWTYVLQQD